MTTQACSIRNVVAAHVNKPGPVWDGRTISWAWMDPHGKVFILDDPDEGPAGGSTGHDRWARKYWKTSTRGSYDLLAAGWVRMLSPFVWETIGPRVKGAVQEALFLVMVDAVTRHNMDPEEERVFHSWGRHHESMTVVDWVVEHGGQEWMDRLFGGLL